MSKKLQVAVIVEKHAYNVVKFQKMLDSFTNCDCYVQPLDLFVQDEDNRKNYDTVLYYSMFLDLPPSNHPITQYVENEIGSTSQGIILLHHALLSFGNSELFTEVCGIRNRKVDENFKYTHDQIVMQQIVNPSHPITQDMPNFSLTDETYIMGEPEEPGNTILITTDNKTSIKNIGWVRNYKNSRVFCYAAGHDNHAFSNENFRTILQNAIKYTAGVIT